MSDPSSTSIGSLAPDFSLPAGNGTQVSLADFRGKKNVVLFFIREYYWMQCRSHASQLGRLYNEFKAENCEILLILGEPVDKARQYAEILKLPFQVLSDPDRRVYQKYELDKLFQLVQRTASLVIDLRGVIRYSRVVYNPLTWLQESRGLLDFVVSMEKDTTG